MARKSLMRGDSEQAEQRLCLSVHLDSRGPGTLDLIRFQLQKGDVAGAKSWATWAVRERPEDPEPKQLLADAVHQEGSEPVARALLLDSMSITAADVAVIRSVANRYANAGFRALDGADPAQADRLFRRATTLDPKHALGVSGRARVALGAGDATAAAGHAERAVELDPQLFEGHLALGDAYAKQGQTDKARTEWLTAAALKPGTREARERLGL
jgi:Flp pilus assembly protein TadD